VTMGLFQLFGQGNKVEKEFKFKEPKNTAVFTCDHVVNKERVILFASHDEDGDWQFLCGHDDHTTENAKIVSLEQMVQLDRTINELFEMPTSVGAERKKVGAKWNPFRL